MSLFIAVLFFVLTPGIFLSLPANASFRMRAMFHAVIFALIYHLTHKMVWNTLYGGYSEGFRGVPLPAAVIRAQDVVASIVSKRGSANSLKQANAEVVRLLTMCGDNANAPKAANLQCK